MTESITEARLPLGRKRQRVLNHAAGVWSAANRYAAVLLVLVAVFIFFSLTQPGFFTNGNLQNLLTTVSVLSVVAFGMTFVIITGGIDLSVGSLLALAGLILAKLIGLGLPPWLALIGTLAAAAAIGAGVNGILIGYFRLSFFVVTLGGLSLYEGIDNIWSGTKTIYISSSLIDGVAFGTFLGLQTPIWIMLGALLTTLVVLRWTYFGRDVYAVGGNIAAARLSGINVKLTLLVVYGVSGFFAGLAGILEDGRLGAASPLVGQDIPLSAIAAVLLGGTSFAGGIGGVVGTAVGVLFIGTLQDGLSIAGISSFWQQVVTGTILILAIGIDRLQQQPRRSFRRATPAVAPQSEMAG
ncbi:MAG TPA: ABC transporter permease [Gaiellaceae bacterium]|jgi:ribose/xylose/arabinose/galactoside ABC-type transport system permease subunit